jgi:integrase
VVRLTCELTSQVEAVLAYVKEQMGHYSIRVTADTYGHLVPGGNKAAVDRLDEPGSVSRVTTRPGLTPG